MSSRQNNYVDLRLKFLRPKVEGCRDPNLGHHLLFADPCLNQLMDCTKFIKRYCNFDRNLLGSLSPNQIVRYQDLNFSNHLKNVAGCDYYDPYDSIFSSKPFNYLFILFADIRSLIKNFFSFYDLLHSLPKPPDIMCMSETRITQQPSTNV